MKNRSNWEVYIIRAKTGKFYTGITTDLDRRFSEHQEGGIAVHHVGFTAVPGLAAKPKIDIIAVVKNTSKIIPEIENLGYEYRGEFNIPLHCGFSKREPDLSVNLHVYEEGLKLFIKISLRLK
jgi:GrpB-like predicted nucleotidyltransferase (UPF0157 family)